MASEFCGAVRFGASSAADFFAGRRTYIYSASRKPSGSSRWLQHYAVRGVRLEYYE